MINNETFIEKQAIQKGWSDDRKYRVTVANGTKYLLRISPIEQYSRKKKAFERMQQVSALGIPMCQPIGFGTCDEGVYIMQSWIDGDDAEDMICTLSQEAQYTYGVYAGHILKTIPSLLVPANQVDWEIRFNQKMNRKIQQYHACPLHYEEGELLIAYLQANRHLLKNRPQCYQHGDFHIGNMMIDTHKKLQIIDFDRDDYGDPWEEWNRIVWSAQ